MKKVFYLIAIVGFIVSSCAKTDNPNEEKTYSFEIGAEKETAGTDETRVEYVDGLMHWSVGDQIGMFITHSFLSPIRYIDNFAMTGRHTEPTRTTTFAGKLTQSQISQFDPNNTYRHISFYPYISSMKLYGIQDNYGVILHYNLPSTITARPNEFPTDMVYMLADGGVASPMTWLENGEQRWSETRTFTYKHTMAYLRLRLNQNLTGRTISTIGISTDRRTGSSRGGAVPLSGNVAIYSSYPYEGERVLTYNMAQNDGTAYDRITVSIEGGVLNVGDYIYIPIPPNYLLPIMDIASDYYNRLRFDFYYKSGSSNLAASVKILQRSYEERLAFEAGKIYDISFNL